MANINISEHSTHPVNVERLVPIVAMWIVAGAIVGAIAGSTAGATLAGTVIGAFVCALIGVVVGYYSNDADL